ncbi:MAG: RIP metalloprotease RseP [Caulobacterales bacterium]
MLAFLQNAAGEAFVYVVPFLLIITVIITVHELGHFLTARACGVAVDRFSIGFGRAVASFRDRWGVEWRIGWLPLGGYVKFAGDENAASVPDQDDLDAMRADIVAREGEGAEQRYLPFKPLWQRALVVAAGPLANFVLAVVLFTIFFSAFGEPVTSTRISDVLKGAPAEKAGLRVGDRLLSADGQKIGSFEDFVFHVQYRANVPIRVTVDRAGHAVDLVVTPMAYTQDSPFGGKQSIGRIGAAARGLTVRHFGPIGAVVRGARQTWTITDSTVFLLGRLFTGQADVRQLGSLIGMARATGAVTKEAAIAAKSEKVNLGAALTAAYLQVAALLSVSIGLLNLLPIPVLDGGHLLFYAYESVARRPVRANIQAAGYRVGLALLVFLMLFATWNDLQRLQVFKVFGGLFS